MIGGRRFSLLRLCGAALAGLVVSSALADPLPNPVTPRDVGKILGKAISDEKQEAIAESGKTVGAGDWKLGFTNGPEGGLYRDADTRAAASGDDAAMTFEHVYADRCDGKERKSVAFDLGLPEKNFPIKGKTGERQAVGWVSFVSGDKPATTPKRQAFGADEMYGDLHASYDPELLKGVDAMVVCPTSKPWDGASKACVRFGFKGFAQAFAYVCDAKAPGE